MNYYIPEISLFRYVVYLKVACLPGKVITHNTYAVCLISDSNICRVNKNNGVNVNGTRNFLHVILNMPLLILIWIITPY